MKTTIKDKLLDVLRSFRDSQDIFESKAKLADAINDLSGYLYYKGMNDGITLCIKYLSLIVDTSSDDCHGSTVAASGGR